MLASGGADQQLKLWSLKVQSHYALATVSSNFSDSIVGVDFSRNSNAKAIHNQCFGLSAAGEFMALTLTPSFLEPLVFSRYSYEETQEKHVERLIYIRKFDTAYNSIIELAQKYKEQNK